MDLTCIYCRDKTVRVWEWNAGEGYVDMSYSPLIGHKYGVTCIRFSPQGTMLATSSVDGSTILWSVHVGICFIWHRHKEITRLEYWCKYKMNPLKHIFMLLALSMYMLSSIVLCPPTSTSLASLLFPYFILYIFHHFICLPCPVSPQWLLVYDIQDLICK
jgi:WD40 repeat protein